MTRKNILFAALITFAVGFLIGMAAHRPAKATPLPFPSGAKIYQINYGERKCEICGTNKPEFFRMRHRRSDGDVIALYLCKGCYEFIDGVRAKK